MKCSKCKIKKELSGFYKDKNSSSGLNSICKICRKRYWEKKSGISKELKIALLLDDLFDEKWTQEDVKRLSKKGGLND